jgi:dipeptidyl-peptidase-4
MQMARRKWKPRFPIEAIARVPVPGMALPNTFSFSQDDALLTYLLGSADDPTQQLWALETTTGDASVLVTPPEGGTHEDALSLEEELRRQRERSLAVGLTAYRRAEKTDRLLIPMRGDLYVLDEPRKEPRLVAASDGGSPAQTPTQSPDGEWIAYVREGEVYVVPAMGGEPRQLTSGARGAGKTHGLAEYIAQEELDRREGFWWSPDSRWIAFEEVDETHIPEYLIAHQGSSDPHEREVHRYPFAGAENARVRLGIVAAEGGESVWLDLDFGEEIYLARVFWWREGQPGAVVVNRPQDKQWLVRFDRATGRRETVLVEDSDVWINVPVRGFAQLDAGGFVWASERSGFRHLYHYDGDGALRRQLTSGDWMVDDLVGVDERRGIVYFTGNREDPREKQLYAVALAGGEVRRITRESGTHEVTLDHAHRRFVDIRSGLDTPPVVTLRSLEDDTRLQSLPLPPDKRLGEYRLVPPELVEVRNREGVLLYGALYRPDASFGPAPYPTIVHVYGGPHAQMVTNSWGRMTAAMDLQYLRSLGFLVFRLDNRGSARRGLAFEGTLKHRMGSIEVVDQVDGVRWLIEQGLADPARVGVMGWSYGGYMSLMCLAKASDVFKLAVAGAPVTSKDAYDTAYTERYMGTPASNPEGYRNASVLEHVDGIRGKLLLIHGMLDENVHFRHTARLINALIRARKPYDALLFPDERHMPRHPADRIYLQERIVEYFRRNL